MQRAAAHQLAPPPCYACLIIGISLARASFASPFFCVDDALRLSRTAGIRSTVSRLHMAFIHRAAVEQPPPQHKSKDVCPHCLPTGHPPYSCPDKHCLFWHPSKIDPLPYDPAGRGRRRGIPCQFFTECTVPRCSFKHPSPPAADLSAATEPAKAGDFDLCMRVVSQYNVNVVPRDWGVLHQMAMQNYSHRGNLQRLYEMGADINIISRTAKDTPLHVAAANGSTEFVNELLLLRADHLKPNAAGKTPCDVATESGHEATASLLRRCMTLLLPLHKVASAYASLLPDHLSILLIHLVAAQSRAICRCQRPRQKIVASRFEHTSPSRYLFHN
jgi:hypothetical protein